MTNAATIARPPLRPDAHPRVPHTVHLRELTLLDGRRMLLDRRSVAFVCQGKPEEFNGKNVCIVAFKGWAKPIPVIEGYHDIKAWWRGDDGVNGKAA